MFEFDQNALAFGVTALENRFLLDYLPAAKGDYASLDDRLDAIETGKQDVIEDLESIRSGAEKGATAVQPEDLKTVATTGDYNDLENKPSELSDFDNDVAVVFEENDNPASLIS